MLTWESVSEYSHSGSVADRQIGSLMPPARQIAHCEAVRDYVSRDLFAKILASEEEHVDWLETQLDLIKRLGEGPYLQTTMSKD